MAFQIIPLTAVSERRDDPEWVSTLYPFYAKACATANKANEGFCEKNGWGIVQAGLLAETGEIDAALEMAAKIPDKVRTLNATRAAAFKAFHSSLVSAPKVFISQGGDGNSRANTIWFIVTRKEAPMTER